MKKITRILGIMLIVTMLVTIFYAFAITASAEEDPIVTETEQIPEETPAETPTDTPTEEPTEEPVESVEVNETLLGRVFEWFKAEATNILGGTNLGLLLAYVYASSKNKNGMMNGLGKVFEGQKTATIAAEAAKEATSVISSDQKAMWERIEYFAKEELERDKVVKALLYEVATLIRLQHTITLNNANIPQPIKDYATALCSNCLAAVNDDESLKKAYDQMRDILGISKSEVTSDEANNS